MASASVGPRLDHVGVIVVPRSAPSGSFYSTDPDLIEATQFGAFIVGFSQTRSDEEWGRVGAVLGVDERGHVHFLGNCESHLTDSFRDLVMVEVPELAGVSERDAWLRLVGDESLWPAVDELWQEPPPADPVETWLATSPDERILDRLSLGPELFAELQQVGLDVVLPSWWADADLVLCAYIAGVSWTEECLGPSLGEATVQRDAWVDRAGVLELHLVDSTNPPTSVRRLATINDLWGRDTSVRVAFPATADEALAADDTAEVSDGDRQVDTTPGLPDPAVHVDADEIPRDG